MMLVSQCQCSCHDGTWVWSVRVRGVLRQPVDLPSGTAAGSSCNNQYWLERSGPPCVVMPAHWWQSGRVRPEVWCCGQSTNTILGCWPV